jgi:hypothetical protein
VVAYDAVGNIHHNIRYADGYWQGWALRLFLPTLRGLDLASVNGQLYLLIQETTKLSYTIRAATGAWSALETIPGTIGLDANSPTDGIAAAGDGEALHVLYVSSSGSPVRHGMRTATGSWTSFGDASWETGLQGGVTSVDASVVDGQLQIVTTRADRVYHTIRYANGSWQAVGLIGGQTHNTVKAVITGTFGADERMSADQTASSHIVSTIGVLAWPDRSHGLTAKPAYVEALRVVGLSTHSDYYARIGASCDSFVATVMRYSGLDPSYQCCRVTNQMNYLRSQPSRYLRITNQQNTSNLQPGDILVSSEHTLFYIGDGKEASASYGQRTADYGRPIAYRDSSGSLYEIYRFIG